MSCYAVSRFTFMVLQTRLELVPQLTEELWNILLHCLDDQPNFYQFLTSVSIYNCCAEILGSWKGVIVWLTTYYCYKHLASLSKVVDVNAFRLSRGYTDLSYAGDLNSWLMIIRRQDYTAAECQLSDYMVIRLPLSLLSCFLLACNHIKGPHYKVWLMPKGLRQDS